MPYLTTPAGGGGLDALGRVLGCLGNVRARINPLRRSYRSRNPAKIEKVLQPVALAGMYAWVLEEDGVFRIIIYRGSKYRVEKKRVWRSDNLSGLRIRLVILEGYVDGRLVWRTVWRATQYSVEFPETPDVEVLLGPGGPRVFSRDPGLREEIISLLEKC